MNIKIAPVIGRIGHNGGPELPTLQSWIVHSWRKAHAKAWKTPSIEIVRMRCARARKLGLSYRDYTSVILDRGRHLQAAVFVLAVAEIAGNDHVHKKLLSLRCPVLIITNDPPEKLLRLCPNVVAVASYFEGAPNPTTLRETLTSHAISPMETFLVGSREQDSYLAQTAGLAKFIPAERYFSS
jgi:phosphoglycolate phosphatase-like HAD superfamily hydrolase